MIRIAFVLFLSLLMSCSTKPKEQVEENPPANDLPYLSTTLLNGQSIDLRNVPGKAILIIFFPDCDHCQREATAIRERIEAFKKYNLYFLSSNESSEIEKFAVDYKLNDQPNVNFGKVEAAHIIQTFGAIPTPSVYIFSSEKKLVKQFNGETNIEEIIKFL